MAQFGMFILYTILVCSCNAAEQPLFIKQINVKNCSLSTTYNGEMTHRKQQK